MRYLIALLLYVLVFASCTVLKNGVSYSGIEKIFSNSWNESVPKIRQATGREPGWELGFVFVAHKEARLRGIWIKNPSASLIPVSIWDAETKQLLHSFQFRITDTLRYNHFVLQQPIPLQANKNYCISINVVKYYFQPLVFARLPLYADNCSLISNVYEESHYSRYPQYTANEVIHGLIDIDLDFKQ